MTLDVNTIKSQIVSIMIYRLLMSIFFHGKQASFISILAANIVHQKMKIGKTSNPFIHIFVQIQDDFWDGSDLLVFVHAAAKKVKPSSKIFR